MVAGPGGIQGAGSLDMPGFFMSFSGVPGFNTGAVQNMLGTMMDPRAMAGGQMSMQQAMAMMRTVGARAGMGGIGGL